MASSVDSGHLHIEAALIATGEEDSADGRQQAVDAFTDGACSGNPGPGGWGVLLRWGLVTRELSGAEPMTTNNRMELTAAIMALEALRRPVPIRIHTDSQYLKDGITRWIAGWKRNGWRTASRDPVKNQDLWQRLDAAATQHQIDWLWIKGHAGHADNERADLLARLALAEGRADRTSPNQT